MGIRIWVFGLTLLIAISSAPSTTLAEDLDPVSPKNIEIHLDLTRQFYEALRQVDSGKTRSLGTNLSEEYLQKIEVSARFIVETNLRLLKEQAEIKALLQDLVKTSHKH